MSVTSARNKTQQTSWTGIALSVLRGGTVAFGMLLMLVGIASLMCYKGVISTDMSGAYAVLVCLICSYVGMIITKKKAREGGIVYPIGIAAFFYMIVMSISVTLFGAAVSVTRCALCGGACLCGSGLGALSKNKKRKKRR